MKNQDVYVCSWCGKTRLGKVKDPVASASKAFEVSTPFGWTEEAGGIHFCSAKCLNDHDPLAIKEFLDILNKSKA